MQPYVSQFASAGARFPVDVTIGPEEVDGSVLVYAAGYAVDAVCPDFFGGFRAYARGKPLHSGRAACRSIEQAVQQALND